MTRTTKTASALFIVCIISGYSLFPAIARDPDGRYANSPNKDWYQKAETTLRSRARLGFDSCCAHSDVVKTRFRVASDGSDDWEYLDGNTWREVPPDIIHHDRSAPGGEPVMFAILGIPVCFFKPSGGI